ncbi:MAG TPA: hypothetical protein VFE71_01955 [Bacteroidales bacterium]|nr:hypothetical protein [Bacteroidales bacterium]
MKNLCRIFILFLTVLLFSCSKKTANDPDYISNEIKDYLVYQPGSNWIYYGDLTKKFDTAILKTILWSIDPPQEDNTNSRRETCFMNFGGTFFRATSITPDFLLMDIHNHAVEPLYPPSIVPGKTFFVETVGITYLNIIDSLTILNTTYHNVLGSNCWYINSQNDTMSYKCWFVKHIGLIKYVQKESGIDSTWYLKEYHVVQ